jgi:hypothetical protein
MPAGLVALLQLWEYASLRFTGRPANVVTMFYNMRSGDPFTENVLSAFLVRELSKILSAAGLPPAPPRQWRHIYATTFSDFAWDMGGGLQQLKSLQERAAEMMGTSRSKFKVWLWVVVALTILVASMHPNLMHRCLLGCG